MRRLTPFRWLVLAAVLVAGASLTGVKTTEATVTTIGPDDSITDTIAGAFAGSTIILSEGTYYEEVVVTTVASQNITVKGANSNVVIRPPVEGSDIKPATSSCAGLSVGICISFSTNFTFKQITVAGFDVGVGIVRSDMIRVEDVRALDNGLGGIIVYDSEDTTLYRNVTNHSGSSIFGILALESNYSEIRLNRTERSAIGIAIARSPYSEVVSNTARNNCAGIVAIETTSVAINGNTSHDNTAECNLDFDAIFDAGATLAGEPDAGTSDSTSYLFSGIGILVSGSENLEIRRNSLTGNRSAFVSPTQQVIVPFGGIVVTDLVGGNSNLLIAANFLRRNYVDIHLDGFPVDSTGKQNRCRSSVQSIPAGFCNFVTASP
ncbi:MAG: NosD domain-containing protein [Dehalococcoidia bacterium]